MSGESLAGLGPDELRAMVREVLRDVLPAAVTARRTTDGPVPEHVVLRTDGDLDALLRRVAAQCADPARREAIHEGRHGFRLAAGDAVTTTAGPAAAPAARTERRAGGARSGHRACGAAGGR